MPRVIDRNKSSGNQTGKYQEGMAGEVGFPTSVFPSNANGLCVENYHAGELLCRIFARIATVFLSMLDSHISIEIAIDPL